MRKEFLSGERRTPGSGLFRRLFLALVILSLGAFPLGAQGFLSNLSWFAGGSILFFPEDNGNESDPMPILPSPGLGLSCPVTDMFRVELTLDFYFTHYGYSYTLNRAVPDAIENRTSQVIGSVLGLQAAWYFDLGPVVTLRAYGGPSADMRIVLVAEDLTNESAASMEDIRERTDAVRSYFWSSGRWFLPVAGVGADFALNSRFKLGIDFRVWIPAYRLWTGENLPAAEGWRFGPGIRFTLR